MSGLVRAKTGVFTLDDAVDIEAVKKMSRKSRAFRKEGKGFCKWKENSHKGFSYCEGVFPGRIL